MPTMRFEQVGDTLVIMHPAVAPADGEWEAMLAHVKARWPPRVLVFTDGGGPNTVQRGRLNDTLGGKDMTTAVVTPSAVVRGIVTALSWFNRGMRSFSPNEASAALSYLAVPVEEQPALMEKVLKLSHELKSGGLRCVVWSDEDSSRVG